MNTWTRRANAMTIVGGLALLAIVFFTGFTVNNDGRSHCARANPDGELLGFEFIPTPLGVQCEFDGDPPVTVNHDLASLPALLASGLVVAGVVIRVRQD